MSNQDWQQDPYHQGGQRHQQGDQQGHQQGHQQGGYGYPGPQGNHGGPQHGPQNFYRPQQRKSWARRHPVLLTFLTLTGLFVLAIGGCTAILGAAVDEEMDKNSVASVEPGTGEDGQPDSDGEGEKAASDLPEGVYRFGDTVTFGDGNTLTVGKPVKFERDQWAAGGEDYKHAVKFKVTFVNNSDEVFDPALTSGNATSGEREGESIFQSGLDAPDNKVLPGKKVTWWMGYGIDKPKDVTLTVSVGFLDYDDVIFTNNP